MGSIDIDALFDDDDDDVEVKDEKEEETGGKGGNAVKEDVTSPRPKPKRGRLISNEAPLEDFNRLVEGEEDVFRKAILDLGAVVKENVAASFSTQAFPVALECLKAMRRTALVYEEVDTYNT